ncbi:MAG TPA: UDP-N-acetylmuramate dehydrogenase [Actinomycetota bacterium]|nr:UDP-N-acetylmuramate dehydrogenase [Actinomycetota bacterium]
MERRLRGRVRGAVACDVSLARFTTYRLGGPAALCVEPAGASDLELLGDALRAEGVGPDEAPVLVLGRGSNVVVSDAGWPGVVVRVGARLARVDADGERGLRAGAGTSLPLVANWAARRGLSGMEFAVAIPGSVGGGVRMNAGAHGRDVAGALVRATVFDLRALDVSERAAHALDLSYRHSNLADHEVVLDATFELEPAPRDDVRRRMDDYRRHRAETQPGAVQNAGSTFKNPDGDAAGRLVEAAGLKGFRVGGARVSELHANFFVADDGASAQDVYDLVAAVRARVHDRFGVGLETEVRFVGAFGERVESTAGGSR